MKKLVKATLAATLLASAGAQAQEDNGDLTAAIAALIGVHNAALPLSFVPDPFIGIPSSAVTYGTNLGLKYVKPVLAVPPGWSDSPNSSDQCTYNFSLPQSLNNYTNLLGFINLRSVRDNWGEFTRDGGVTMAHANTDVTLTLRGPGVTPNRETSQTVRIPAGRHTYDWQAATQLSQAWDIIIPGALLGFNIGYYGAMWADLGANAVRQAGRQAVARETVKAIAQEVGLIGGGQTSLFNSETTVVHERTQDITIFDVVPPTISASQSTFTFEATDFGGVDYSRVRQQIAGTITASDGCGRPHTLGNNAPRLLPIGDTNLRWTVSDLGPTVSGGVNTRTLTQTLRVRDTQAPILVPPPSRVIEVPAVESGIFAAGINLGSPRVVDLADPQPLVTSNSPLFYPKDSRTPIVWTATDASGNARSADQLITVKTEGENTAPVVSDIAASTLTSQPVDIVLSGSDGDFIDGRFDPLNFRITQRPANGEFQAPLFPFFIEDYRTNPAGPYGEDFRLSDNQSNWLNANVCRDPALASLPPSQRIALDWVYQPRFLHVTDDGTYFMIDFYWRCGASDASTQQRISKWDADGNFIGQTQYPGTNETFVMDQDGFLYTLSRTGSGSSASLSLRQNRTDFSLPDITADSWRFDSASTTDLDRGLNDPISPGSLSYARVDSQRGLLYITDRRRVFVFDVREDFADGVDASDNSMRDKYLGALKNGEEFLRSTWGNSWTGYAMEVDAEGALYVTDSGENRIHKFSPSFFDESGDFVMGDYIGWLGRCDTSTNNACDEDTGTSRGYACTDETCSVVASRTGDDGLSRRGSVGWEPGQFNAAAFIALDPNGVLYVADAGQPNAGGRVQRFGPDGTFGGEARSTGTGINQGERPGFVLGNLGTVKAVSVNSTSFFVVDQEESFVHVFETTPSRTSRKTPQR
jgi:hypothetical protein